MAKSILAWISQATIMLGTVIILTVAFTPEILAQVEREMKESKVEREQSDAKPMMMQIKPAKSKNMPKNTTLGNICDPNRMSTSRRGNVLTIKCAPQTPAASSTLAAKPDVQRSDINCKYTDDGDGGLKVDSCTCKADSDSNCTGFITWCAQQGADVGGNNQSATCD